MISLRQFAFAAIVLTSVFLLGAVTVVNLATQVTGLLAKTNGGTGINSTATFPSSGTVTVTFASGTAAMTTSAIAAGSCGSTVTVAASGVATTDTIDVAGNSAATTTNGRLDLNWWPTAGNVNFNYCNSSSASITPAARTLNWKVFR